MGPLLTSKAKKETLEAHSPWRWGWGGGHGPTLDGKALGLSSLKGHTLIFKTSLTQTMSNALKHSLLQRGTVDSSTFLEILCHAGFPNILTVVNDAQKSSDRNDSQYECCLILQKFESLITCQHREKLMVFIVYNLEKVLNFRSRFEKLKSLNSVKVVVYFSLLEFRS